MPVDILAIAAHRDDVELTCAGTLLKAVDAGYRAAILDLTAGYTAMALTRIDRRAYTELDPANKATWHHHGAQYELFSYPT